MKKVFLDASVLVAACASKTGASGLTLGLCRLEKIQGYVSLDVIGEARKNVYLKLKPVASKRLAEFLKLANLLLVPPPSIEEISHCEQAINPKDASILAAALKSPASFLVTLDKKHFLQPKVINFAQPLKVTSPKDLVLKHLKIQSS